jgi:hypothetical protein
MKYLFITLEVQDGENRHTHRVLSVTSGNNIQFAAQRYAATYYGDNSDHQSDWWYFYGGTIAVKMVKVDELTEFEYKLISRIFSGDNRDDFYSKFNK